MNYSKQCDAIINYLKSVKTHPTAETIYNDLKKDYPELSLGTVYRNLDKLTKLGKILRLKDFGDKDRFDGKVARHYHAECVKCKNVYDIFCEYFVDIDTEIKNLGYEVLSHDIKFNIICSNCKKKIKEEVK